MIKGRFYQNYHEEFPNLIDLTELGVIGLTHIRDNIFFSAANKS